MKTIYFNEHGGPEVLLYGDRPDPVPGPGQVRLRVRACAVNRLDQWVRLGIPGLEIPRPHIPGSDVAGEVESLGPGVTGWSPGQRVVVAPGLSCGACAACRAGEDLLCPHYDILGQRSNGGCAEWACVPAVNLFPLPKNLSFEQAASIPLVYLTAWHMLIVNGELRPGQTVLLHSAGSGLGTAALQIARARGARVFATVGSEAKIEPAKSQGADTVALSNDPALAEKIQAWSGGQGVDVVFNHVGQVTFEMDLQVLTRGGRLVVCGATSGRQAQFDLRVLFGKNLKIFGSRLGRRESLREILQGFEQGLYTPVLDRIFPLAETADAHRRMEERRNFGKIVIEIPG